MDEQLPNQMENIVTQIQKLSNPKQNKISVNNEINKLMHTFSSSTKPAIKRKSLMEPKQKALSYKESK